MLAISLGGSYNRNDYLRQSLRPKFSWNNPSGHNETYTLKAEQSKSKQQCKASLKMSLIGESYLDYKLCLGHKLKRTTSEVGERSQQVKMTVQDQNKTSCLRIRGRWVSNVMKGGVLESHQNNHQEWGVKYSRQLLQDIYEYEDNNRRGHNLRASLEVKASDVYSSVIKGYVNY